MTKPLMRTLAASIALDRAPPNRRDALRECEACMWLLLQKAARGESITHAEHQRFVRAQQRARIVIAREVP